MGPVQCNEVLRALDVWPQREDQMVRGAVNGDALSVVAAEAPCTLRDGRVIEEV